MPEPVSSPAPAVLPAFYPAIRTERRNPGNTAFPLEGPDRRGAPERRTTKGRRILMFGRIRELALYRAEVLRDRGFEVATPDSREDAIAAIRKGNFDVAILTYTLPNEIVQELAQLVREHCPACPLIAISNNTRMDREIRPDLMVNADDGPQALIAALRRVVRTN
jgi:CheY-like chemotaxis protein